MNSRCEQGHDWVPSLTSDHYRCVRERCPAIVSGYQVAAAPNPDLDFVYNWVQDLKVAAARE